MGCAPHTRYVERSLLIPTLYPLDFVARGPASTSRDCRKSLMLRFAFCCATIVSAVLVFSSGAVIPQALAQGVTQLLSHSGQTEEMSQRGYQAVVTVCHGGRLSRSYLQDLSVQGCQATRQQNANAVYGNSRLRGRAN